jgi:hypothetical protein
MTQIIITIAIGNKNIYFNLIKQSYNYFIIAK